MATRLLQWTRNIPDKVKGTLGLLTAVITFIVLFRSNFNLGVVVAGGAVLIALLLLCIHVAYSKTERRAGIGGDPKYRYPKYRLIAKGGMALIGLISLALLLIGSTRTYIYYSILGKKLAPTASVLIAQFDAVSGSKYDIPRRLKNNLDKELRRHGLEQVEVKIHSERITDDAQAKEVAEQSASKIIIWGWYDEAGITIKLFTLKPDQREEDLASLKEVPWAKESSKAADLSFQVREQLPQNTSFLSLFVIGHLYFLNNEYQKGHQAFDAAMANIPQEIGLENKSILHFFAARGLEAAGGKEVGEIMCEYAEAIKLNPGFAAPYNNLGIALSNFYTSPDSQSVTSASDEESVEIKLPKDGEACLKGLNIDWSDPKAYFEKAVSLQPDSAVFRYNKLAYDWRLAGGYEGEDAAKARAQELEALRRQDPTIPGVQIMLGTLAFPKEDANFTQSQFEIALTRFTKASELLPSSSELLVNIGKLYQRRRQSNEARAQFKKALNVDPHNAEANLALADIHHRQGAMDVALKYLAGINPAEVKDTSLVRMAAILRSRIYFDTGVIASAIEALQDNLARQPEKKNRTEEGICYLTPNDHSLVRYLLGLLYAINSDAGSATANWRQCCVVSPAESEIIDGEDQLYNQFYYDNDTASLAWYDLLKMCNPTPPVGDVALWGSTSHCLPGDLNSRLSRVYDVAQSRLVHRIFYRDQVQFGGLECPYVFSYDARRKAWDQDTVILYKLVGPHSEELQTRPLMRFDGRLLIKEVEPEVSYIDHISVLVSDESGQVHELSAQIPALQKVDGLYLRLTQGNEVRLSFKDFDLIKSPRRFWIKSRGYYLPTSRNPRIFVADPQKDRRYQAY